MQQIDLIFQPVIADRKADALSETWQVGRKNRIAPGCHQAHEGNPLLLLGEKPVQQDDTRAAASLQVVNGPARQRRLPGLGLARLWLRARHRHGKGQQGKQQRRRAGCNAKLPANA